MPATSVGDDGPQRRAKREQPARASDSATEDTDAPVSDFGNVRTSIGEVAGLHYLEVVIGADAATPMPLVIGLHGLGDRPRLPYPPYEGLPVPVRVVAPRAPDPHGNGYSWFPVRVRDDQPKKLAASMRRRADRLARFIRVVRERHPTRGGTIVTGFSQGGMLTYALAVLHPELVDIAFPLAGWLPPPLVPEQRKAPTAPNPPIRAMHARDDPVVPIAPTRASVRRLEDRGFDIELRTFDGAGHGMSEPMNALMHRWLASAVR